MLLVAAGCTEDAALPGRMSRDDAEAKAPHFASRNVDGGDAVPASRDAAAEEAEMRPEDEAVASVAAALQVDFERCSLYTGLEVGERFGGADAGAEPERAPSAECATLELPLRWAEPEGPQIDWFVKRLRATERSRGQLWLLQGGPGSSGAGLEGLAEDIQREVPDLDIYIPDHRGVGRSTLFECGALGRFALGSNEAQVAACGAELREKLGEDTKEFSTTSASRDVLAVAMNLHREGRELMVWGASYGGFWTHRLLQVDAARVVTAAVLDSSALPIGGRSTVYQTTKTDEAGQTLFAECAKDPTCSGHLGNDPRAYAMRVLDDLCPPVRNFGERPYFQTMLSAALRQWRLLRLLPAMIYRAQRCTDADVDALSNYADQIGPSDRYSPDEAPESDALLVHVGYSELTTELSAPEDVILAAEEVVFSDIAGSVDWRAALADWPLYEPDDFMGRWAETDIPLLLLHGGLDTQTPANEGHALFAQFTAPQQQSHFFPTGGHGVYYRTHDVSEDGMACAAFITHQFLLDPTSPVDASCIEETPPLDFSADEELLLEIFGDTDVWGDSLDLTERPDRNPLPER